MSDFRPLSSASSSTSSSIPRKAQSASSPNQSSPSGDNLAESRKRQTKRDDAIRRKLETDLAKRRNPVGKTKQLKRPPPGTVLALKPSPPLTMRYNTSIHEASQFMSAKRENCVLVLDDEEQISGIFTAKDLAFKVVGSGLSPNNMTIDHIMTPNPMCARTDTSATEALNLMVSKGFRHLPVVDENQEIAGVLDITKCFYEAMQKLERAYESSRKLHDALEGVQSELGGIGQPQHIISYVEALKSKTEGPDLNSVLGNAAPPVYVDVRTSVAEAAALMKEHRTTAVLVTDQKTITGIFTSKDVVLRVIAAGLDPRNCSVVRVMTPHPDFAPRSMSIQQALRKMHDGHYLNLPVMGDDNEIIGIVDVLRLTYATLEQINSMNTGSAEEGPAWNKFWMSLDQHDSESAVSAGSNEGRPLRSASRGSHGGHGSSAALGHSDIDEVLTSPVQEASPSEIARFNIGIGGELGPDDSVSRMGRPDSRLLEPEPSIAIDAPFSLKFKAPSGRSHRMVVTAETTIDTLHSGIIEKLSAKEIDSLGGRGHVENDKISGDGFAISYLDDEGDFVAVTTSGDIADIIGAARKFGFEKADIFLHHPHEELDKTNVPSKRPKTPPPVESSGVNEHVPGIPNELLLPGAIVTLAVAIVLVFSFSRGHR